MVIGPMDGGQWAAAFDHLSAAVALVDADQLIISANAAFRRLFAHAGVVGLALGDVVMAGLDGFRLRDGDSVELQCRRANGTRIWAVANARRLSDGAEGPFLVEFTDVDRYKRSEFALADSERRLRVALEAAQQGVWDHDHTNGQKYHSPAWRRMRGLGPADPVPATAEEWFARIHPDDRERVTDYVRRQNAGEFPDIAYDFRERHADGHWLWVLSRGRAVEHDAAGRPRRIIGVDTDITALKTVEAELHAEKERLRVTLESIADGVVSVDANGAVSFMNAVAEELTGWPLAEAVGRPLEEVLLTADGDNGLPLATRVAAALATGEAFRFNAETLLVGRSEQSVGIRASAASIGRDGAVIVFQDVTDSLALQRELAYAASHDTLTGLPNRPAFEEALARTLAHAREDGAQSALCFLDIDRFKAVNDGAGHQAGDALLREIGQLLRGVCRGGDMAARLGGDEFGFILPDCTAERAATAMRRVVERIGALRFVWEGVRYSVGASIGITLLTADTPGLTAALNDADAGCYRAKATGTGGVCIATPDGLQFAAA